MIGVSIVHGNHRSGSSKNQWRVETLGQPATRREMVQSEKMDFPRFNGHI